MIFFSILLSIVYAGMITGIFLASVEPAEKKSKSALGSKRFSIVVAARNEAQNISACVQSLLNQQYPSHQYEVIVVDDHSTDGSLEAAHRLLAEYAWMPISESCFSEGWVFAPCCCD